MLIVLAGIGLALSIVSHIAALFGRPGPLGKYTFFLHIGLFVVALPAVLASRRMTSGLPRQDFWREALRGCPPWTRYVVYGFIYYAGVNFLIFMLGSPPKGGSGPMPPVVVRGFSGHWMAFYAVSMALLYSAARVEKESLPRRCPQGHLAGPAAEFCEKCGRPVF